MDLFTYLFNFLHIYLSSITGVELLLIFAAVWLSLATFKQLHVDSISELRLEVRWYWKVCDK